jgi:hypothetical protein
MGRSQRIISFPFNAKETIECEGDEVQNGESSVTVGLLIIVDEPTTWGEPLTQKGRKLLVSNLFPFWVRRSITLQEKKV